jgi:hypothetical protein
MESETLGSGAIEIYTDDDDSEAGSSESDSNGLISASDDTEDEYSNDVIEGRIRKLDYRKLDQESLTL